MTADCYVYRGVGIRGVVATMAVNVTLLALQRPASRIDATCNDQREPQESHRRQVDTESNPAKTARGHACASPEAAGAMRYDALAAIGREIRTSNAQKHTRDRERDGNQRRVVGITLWYAFNVGYNVYNKKLSNALDYPMLIALTSLGVGILYFAPLWALGLRKAPKLSLIHI